MQITICGGGNAAHTAAGLTSAHPEVQVNVFLPFVREAQLWKEGVSKNGGITVRFPDRVVTGKPDRVSADPAEVLPGSELVLLALPAFAHESYIGKDCSLISSLAHGSVQCLLEEGWTGLLLAL
jgi:hypothetical protein